MMHFIAHFRVGSLLRGGGLVGMPYSTGRTRAKLRLAGHLLLAHLTLLTKEVV